MVDEIEDAAEAAKEAAKENAENASEAGGSGAGIGAAAIGASRRGRRNSFSAGRSGVGVGFMLFLLGLFCGVPMAFFGFDAFVTYSAGFFGFMLGLLGTGVAILIFALVFRRPIWERLYKRGEVEVEKMAAPLADVAKYAAAQRLGDATDAARNFAEMVLARYAWLTTRRWIVGSITGMLAAIAALAGSTLLFQQNKLLSDQSVLIVDQTRRIDDQNFLLETQIALAEAERSALIGPEILNIADDIGRETAKLRQDPVLEGNYALQDLSPGLRNRIVGLTNLARPYRYLVAGEIDPRDQMAVLQKALARRPETLNDTSIIESTADEAKIKLIEQALSPERGQILAILLGSGIRDTELLSFRGADFTFAELRMKTLGLTSYKHAIMSFANFSDMGLVQMKFGAAELYHTNFSGTIINSCDFGGIAAADIEPPFVSSPGLPYLNTGLTGANFQSATIINSNFDHALGLVLDFENAALYNSTFNASLLGGAIFKDAILLNVSFAGASLQSIDLQNAIVFEPDFLERINAQSVAGSFKAERWTLQVANSAALQNHGQYIELSNYVPEVDLNREAYRIIRNPDFVEQRPNPTK